MATTPCSDRASSDPAIVDAEAVLEHVAARIVARRKALGLTQADLASRAGMDRTFLNRVEKGQRNPTLVMLMRVAHGLNTTVGSLVEAL